jgi:hypothetical protein
LADVLYKIFRICDAEVVTRKGMTFSQVNVVDSTKQFLRRLSCGKASLVEEVGVDPALPCVASTGILDLVAELAAGP